MPPFRREGRALQEPSPARLGPHTARAPDVASWRDVRPRAEGRTVVAGRDKGGGQEVVPNAFARGAVAIHLSMRLGSRLLQLVSAHGAATTTRRRLVLATCIVLDLAGARLLHHQSRHRDGAWLALDAADIAVWSALGDGSQDGWNMEQIIGVPLAMEAGARRGLKAMVVAGTCWASGAVSHRLRGQPLRPDAAMWQVFSVVVGAAAARRAEMISRRIGLRRNRYRDARCRVAELAGENSEASAQDSLVDRLARATALLRLSGGDGGPKPPDVASWKSGLAATSRRSATYLGDALFVWQQAHNHHPDLSGAVRVHVREGQGTTLLTSGQAHGPRASSKGEAFGEMSTWSWPPHWGLNRASGSSCWSMVAG